MHAEGLFALVVMSPGDSPPDSWAHLYATRADLHVFRWPQVNHRNHAQLSAEHWDRSRQRLRAVSLPPTRLLGILTALHTGCDPNKPLSGARCLLLGTTCSGESGGSRSRDRLCVLATFSREPRDDVSRSRCMLDGMLCLYVTSSFPS